MEWLKKEKEKKDLKVRFENKKRGRKFKKQIQDNDALIQIIDWLKAK